ncbi:MAG: GTP 3',8-cyclase MoaA [Lutisporaceae bacterium]
MKDTLGRSINYLRISVTDRCNLRCMYCMPEEGICKKEHQDILSLEEIYEVVKTCSELGVNKVRITGGEPLVRIGITNLIEKISRLENIKDIALTTNGVLLEKYAEELKEAGLKRVNISLDTLNEEKYSYITRGGKLDDVMRGIKAAERVGMYPVKLNAVLIGGFNDDEIEAFIELTTKSPIEVRFIELMPLGQAAGWAKKHFVSNSVILDRVKELTLVGSDDPSSPATYYKLPGAMGKVGLINPISHAFCGSCNRIRLTADGKLKPCLHSEEEIDVLNVIRSKGNLQEAIVRAINQKPAQHSLNSKDSNPIKRDMYRIGG